MSQAQVSQAQIPDPRADDVLTALRRILDELESGELAVVKDGSEVTPTYALILRAQIKHLDEIIGR